MIRRIPDGEFEVPPRVEFDGEQLRITMRAPPSKKNRTRIATKRDGTPFVARNSDAEREQKRLTRALMHALPEGTEPLFGECDVAFELRYRPADGEVDVIIYAIRARPRGVTGRRRDLQGLFDVICDALEPTVVGTGRNAQSFRGVVKNDNQVARLYAVREV